MRASRSTILERQLEFNGGGPAAAKFSTAGKDVEENAISIAATKFKKEEKESLNWFYMVGTSPMYTDHSASTRGDVSLVGKPTEMSGSAPGGLMPQATGVVLRGH